MAVAFEMRKGILRKNKSGFTKAIRIHNTASGALFLELSVYRQANFGNDPADLGSTIPS